MPQRAGRAAPGARRRVQALPVARIGEAVEITEKWRGDEMTEIKWMLRNADEQFFGPGLRVVQSSTEATQFDSYDDAVKSCQGGDKPFSPIRMVARSVGRGKCWDIAQCDECGKHPSTFSDPTHDSATGTAQWLCHGCAKHRIEMAMMALSEVRQ